MTSPVDPSLRHLNPCGCCEGPTAQTPVTIDNRPGLSAIAARVGTHPQFKASLLAGLSSADHPALAGLRTREDDDFSIALLDGFAAVADVLSFYSERIANEAYLRTATERRSVLELARLIGYELKPGVAASTYLVFTVEDAPGSPGFAQIDTRTKVQSIPGPAELPQTYETLQPMLARKEWNDLGARSRQLATPHFGLDRLYLQGVNTGLRPGDALLIVGDERVADSTSRRWDFRKVKEVVSYPNADAALAFTIVLLDRPLGSVEPYSIPARQNAKVYALRARAGLFGHNAPDWKSMPDSIKDAYGSKSDPGWPGLEISKISSDSQPGEGSGLLGEYFDNPNFTERVLGRTDPQIDFRFTAGQPPVPGVAGTTFAIRWTGHIQARADGEHFFYARADDGIRLWIEDVKIIDAWKDQPPTEYTGRIARLQRGKKYRIRLEYYNSAGPGTMELYWSHPGQSRQLVPKSCLFPADLAAIHLDALYPGIIPGGWVVLAHPTWQECYEVKAAQEDARTGFTLSAKSTRLMLKGVYLFEKFDDKVRETAVFGQSEFLPWAAAPTNEMVSGNQIILDRLLSEPLPEGRTVLLQSRSNDLTLSEVATVLKTEPADASHTRIILTQRLGYSHRADSVRIYGNVAFATHGETVPEEILGNGDANQSHQRFALRQQPLTYIPDANPTGGSGTLIIRVDGIEWREVQSLYDQGPNDRVYVVRHREGLPPEVLFGDGVYGARLPTGRENIRALYRKGIGRDGILKPDQLKLLMTRPLGIRGVTNPVQTEGAADPQSLVDARTNAPFTVLTLDRIVSLKDYEDYARNFSGIAKSLANWTWNINSRGIFITIAGHPPQTILSEVGRTCTSLLESLQESGNPLIPVSIRSYTPVQFKLSGKVYVKGDYEIKQVEPAVRAALIRAFGFDARSFGQSVALSEVVAVIQAVPGVAFVDLDTLYKGTTPTREDLLTAHRPKDGASVAEVMPAQLLTLDESSLTALEVRHE